MEPGRAAAYLGGDGFRAQPPRAYPSAASRPARRLHDVRGGRPHPVHREGRLAPKPGAVVLSGLGRARVPHDQDGRARARRAHDRRHQRDRGADPRGEPHQAPSAAVQRAAARRQAVSVSQGDQRAVSARRVHAGGEGRRRAVLRAVHQCARLAGADRSRAHGVPAAHVSRADRRAPQAAVPAVPHQALSRAVRRLSVRGRLRQARRRGGAFSRRALRSADRAAAARDERCGGALQFRGGGAAARPHHRGAADDRRAEGGVALADRRGPHRARACAGAGVRGSVHGARRQAARPGVLRSRRCRRPQRRGDRVGVPQAVLHRAHR